MKLLIPLLWIVAVVLAAWLLWRAWRGKPVLLRGRWSPRLVRMVAILLVAVGLGAATVTVEGRDVGIYNSLPEMPGDAPYSPKPPRPFDRDAAWRYLLAEDVNSFASHLWLRLHTFLNGMQEGTLGASERTILEAMLKEPDQPDVLGSNMHAPPETAADHDLEGFAGFGGRSPRATQPATATAPTAGIPGASGIPRSLLRIAQFDLDTFDHKQPAPPTLRELSQALDDAQAVSFYDNWVVGYLWRHSPAPATAAEAAQLANLYARLEDHVRMARAIVRAQATAGPAYYRPWMSKAGPPPNYHPLSLPANFAPTVVGFFAGTDAGPWNNEATVRLTVTAGDAATLCRRGKALPLKAGDVLTFRRLDLLMAPASSDLTLREPATGLTVTIPKGQVVGARDLSALLTPTDRAKVIEWITAGGREHDRSAMEKLEWTLPLTAGVIRDQFAGPWQWQPVLRMLLHTFDE